MSKDKPGRLGGKIAMIAVFGTLTVFFAFGSLINAMLLTFYNPAEVAYYQDDSNYEEVVRIVEEKKGTHGSSQKVLVIEGASADYYADRLRFYGQNNTAVEKSGFWDEVSDGDRVYITTAPGYDGGYYYCPIVAVRTDSKVYLDFETGKANHIAYIDGTHNGEVIGLVVLLINAAVSGGLTVTFVILLVITVKRRRRWAAQQKVDAVLQLPPQQ